MDNGGKDNNIKSKEVEEKIPWISTVEELNAVKEKLEKTQYTTRRPALFSWDDGKEPDPKMEYIYRVNKKVKGVPFNALVTNVKRRTEVTNNVTSFNGYHFDYQGITYWSHYPWAFVENTKANKELLDKMDKLAEQIKQLERATKHLRRQLVGLNTK